MIVQVGSPVEEFLELKKLIDKTINVSLQTKSIYIVANTIYDKAKVECAIFKLKTSLLYQTNYFL